MSTLIESPHAGGFLCYELPGLMSRIQATLNSGQNLKAGAVLGRILAAAATVAGSNIGNGTVTVGNAGSSAVPGTYKLVCVATAANAGTFNFYAPDGTLIRQITVGGGATASDHFVITIVDGAIDFALGDSFSFAVTEGDFEVLNPAGTNGTQIAQAILFDAVDASSADTACAVINKTAVVNAGEIAWPNGISSPNKATAIAQLNARGIVLR